MMRVLLVGNYPPPYGGISVHVQLLHRMLLREGIDCQVLNVDPRAPLSPDYLKVSGYRDFITKLISASRGRVVHLHTNGHNNKSWLIALAAGWAGATFGHGSMLTIHSGMAPDYITAPGNRLLVRAAIARQSSIICVNEQIRKALNQSHNFPLDRAELQPAFLFDERERAPLDESLTEQLSRFYPLVSLVAFFRPEYGVELFIEALSRLTARFPNIGCAVMGSGDGEADLRRLAERHGIADRLLWLGDLDHRYCLSVMKASQLFVRPTLTDGDSISVREAVQLGVPVVASNVGYRPAECLTFPAGDIGALAESCASVLSNPQPILTRQLATADFSPLLKVYRRIAKAQTQPFWERYYGQKRTTIE